jgi:hypothetical protein
VIGRSRLCAAFALVALAASAADTPQDQAVTVELALLNSQVVRLSYHLPPSCPLLPLKTPYSAPVMQELRNSWKPSGPCGREQDGNIVRTDSSCSLVSFDVPVQATTADRVYPPAFPIGGLGVYAHTGLYAPTNACGPVRWQLRSEGGAVVYQGEDRGESVLVPDSDLDAGYMAVYLSERALTPDAKTALSPELPLWIRTGLGEATSQVEAGYRKRFGGLAYSAPFVVASSNSATGQAHYQAEVAAGNMIRYGFFNPSNEPKADDVANFRGVIAHEYGHKLQPSSFHEDSRDPDNLIHEGGAEFLRWTSMIRLGWSSDADAQTYLNTALNSCLAHVGTQPWERVADRAYGDVPYVCGLTLHVLLLASRRDWRETSADRVLESFYRRSQHEAIDVGHALECGAAKGCKARWAPALLSSTQGFAGEIDALIGSTGLAKRRLTEPLPLPHNPAGATLMHLMNDDCGDGSRGFYNLAQGLKISDSPNCKTFHDGMLIESAEGVSLINEPAKAARGMVAQCATRHSTTLGLADGSSIEVACDALPPVAAYFYDLDIRKVLERLGMAR